MVQRIFLQLPVSNSFYEAVLSHIELTYVGDICRAIPVNQESKLSLIY